MAKRPTKAELETRVSELERDRNLYQEAFWCLQNDKPADHTETVPDHTDEGSGGETLYQLYGALRAHGGLVVRTWRYPGQNDYSTPVWLDELACSSRHDPYHAAAVSALQSYRAQQYASRS